MVNKHDLNNEVMLIVAPNGARATKLDHPNLPITPQELAHEAEACLAAGATMIHMHARNGHGKHSLDIQDNLLAMQAVRDQVGDHLMIQLTTEAVGLYQPAQQMELVREVIPEAASFAIKELVPDQASYSIAADFFDWVNQNNILAQFILYSPEDVQNYLLLKKQGIIPADKHHLLFVLGRYSKSLESEPKDLTPFLDSVGLLSGVRWAVCAFGKQEYSCLTAALDMGGDVRVGFENNRQDKAGQLAESNATQVEDLAHAIKQRGKRLLTADLARQRLGLSQVIEN